MIDNVAVTRIGEGFGLASQVARVTVTGTRAPGSVVVKMWRTDSDAGANELRFYRELAPGLGIRLPVCHLAGVDAATRRGVLVLEDLSPARQGDVLEEVGNDDLAAIAAAYARLHTSSPALPAWLSPLRWTNLAPEWFATRRVEFLERFGPQSEPLASLVDRAEHAHRIALDRLAGVPDTLLHKDVHLDNVLFTPDGPVLLDWAGCARGPAELDLAPVVFGMSRPDGYEGVIAAYAVAAGAPVDRARLGGAFLVWCIVHTLGIARWHPASDRQKLMARATVARVSDAVAAGNQTDPGLMDGVV